MAHMRAASRHGENPGVAGEMPPSAASLGVRRDSREKISAEGE
jgi:hypothetical protein